MITNERQYRISKAQLAKFRQAIESFDIHEVARQAGSKLLANAELEALKSEEEILSAQLQEYDSLKSGAVTVLRAENLDELPNVLIRARIARGLSQRELADALGLKEQQIQRYEAEQYASAGLRRLIDVARALNLNISEIAELGRDSSSTRPKKPNVIDWTLFPVKEMYRRNWFGGFSGSLAAALTHADSLVKEYVSSVIRQPVAALHRQRVRSGSDADPYALMAWECRVLKLAEMSPAKCMFVQDALDEKWVNALVKMSRHPDGPARARDYLQEVGISLVVEPHLTHTHLDGAAFLHRNRPVVGLTLRYDRLDNFWFVLVHELVHIIKHLQKDRVESIFDDMEVEPDVLELEADDMAASLLIPDEVWEVALPRYVRSEDSVKSFAEELGISPAIVAGRIRKEANNYVVLRNLIGQNEVRRCFPEVSFGM